MIKSHLKENLTEHINAEIAQGTIVSMETGINWLKNTFMFIRMKNDLTNKNSKNFFTNKINNSNDINKSKNSSELERQLEEQLRNICLKIFKDLATIDLIEFEQINDNKPNNFNDGNAIANTNKNLTNKSSIEINTENSTNLFSQAIEKQITERDSGINYSVKIKKLGNKMCKNYVLFETMKNIITNLIENSEEAILDVLSNSSEFSKYRSKMEDRKILNNINKDINIKYKVKGVIDTFNKKAFLLIQAAFSNLNLEPWELRRQQNEIIQSSLRILNCIKQVYKQRYDVKGLVQILLLKKALNQKMWPINYSEYFLKQFPKIGEKIAKNLFKGGVNCFEKLIFENPRKIEIMTSKNAPFGSVLIDMAKSIPKLELNFELFKNNNYKYNFNVNKNNQNNNKDFNNMNNNTNYKLSLFIKLSFTKLVSLEDFDPFTCYFILAANSKNKLLLKKKCKPNGKEKDLTFNIQNITNDTFPITIYIICEKFVGLDKCLVIENENDKQGTFLNNLNLTNKTLNDYKNINITSTTSTNLININKKAQSNLNTENKYIDNSYSKFDISEKSFLTNKSNSNNTIYDNISNFTGLKKSLNGNLNLLNFHDVKNVNKKDHIIPNNSINDLEIDDSELNMLITQILEEENDDIKNENKVNISNVNKLSKQENEGKKKRNNKVIKQKDNSRNSNIMTLINNMKNNQENKKNNETAIKNNNNINNISYNNSDLIKSLKKENNIFNNTGINNSSNDDISQTPPIFYFNNVSNKNKKLKFIKEFSDDNYCNNTINKNGNHIKNIKKNESFHFKYDLNSNLIKFDENKGNCISEKILLKENSNKENENIKKEAKLLFNFDDFI